MYSGLTESLKTVEWKPSGVPAIYKLIEELDRRGISLDVFFLCKNEKESENIRGIRKVKFKGMNVNFHVFAYNSIPINRDKLKLLYNDCIQFGIIIFKYFHKTKYDLAYFDRVNIVLAAICSLMGIKTVVRFLGVANFRHFTDKVTYALISPLVYLSLKVPYALAICTEDGSPSKYLFSKRLNSKTPYKIVLNGVDKKILSKKDGFSIKAKYNFVEKYPILLFVGRISPEKGNQAFVDVLIRLKENEKTFYSIIITGGDDYSVLYEKICANGLEGQIAFERKVEQNNIISYYEQSDIYISLNKLGNLSNTVLEAMVAEKCIVMLGKDETTHTDESTEMLIPHDVAIRIDRNNIVNDLSEKLAELIDDPSRIDDYSNRMRVFSNKFLGTWEERINYEIELLKRVVKGETITSNGN